MVTIGLVKSDLIELKSNKKSFTQNLMNLLDLNQIKYNTVSNWGGIEFWDTIKNSEYFIARYRGNEEDIALIHSFLPEIERKGVKTLPNFNTAYHCGDKFRLSIFYEANKINYQNTYTAFSLNDIESWIDNNKNKFPIVVKLRKGAGGRNVALAYNKTQLWNLAKVLFKYGVRDSSLEVHMKGNLSVIKNLLVNYTPKKVDEYRSYLSNSIQKKKVIENSCLIMQEFLPDNRYDTRITTIGDKAFGFIRENRIGDFRASGSGFINYDNERIDKRFVEIALNISKKFEFQTMAYDFVLDKN